MRYATRKDEKRVVDILAYTFRDNPGVNWMLKKKGHAGIRYLRRLARLAFIKGMNRNGVMISDNGKGVAIYYRADERVFSPREKLYELFFGLSSIPWSRLGKVLKRESERKSHRPHNGQYLYFWFLGVLPEGKGAGFELKNALFELSRKQDLPIYLETAMERNRQVYEKIGFTTYHEWRDDAAGIHFWFMRWDPREHTTSHTLSQHLAAVC